MKKTVLSSVVLSLILGLVLIGCASISTEKEPEFSYFEYVSSMLDFDAIEWAPIEYDPNLKQEFTLTIEKLQGTWIGDNGTVITFKDNWYSYENKNYNINGRGGLLNFDKNRVNFNGSVETFKTRSHRISANFVPSGRTMHYDFDGKSAFRLTDNDWKDREQSDKWPSVSLIGTFTKK